jgi:hypothetical protein
VIVDVSGVLNTALKDHQEGRRDDARRGYVFLLVLDPANPNALHLLGVLERQDGRPYPAVRLVGRAGRVLPQLPGWAVNMANATREAVQETSRLIHDNRTDEAGDRLAEVLCHAPTHRDVLRNLGTVRLIQGRDEDAAVLAAEADRQSWIQSGETPETGLGVAMTALERHRVAYDFTGTVVIPAYNAIETIERTLDSIPSAVRYYRETQGDPSFKVHISVVDDRSSDRTAEVVIAWARAHPEQSLSLVVNNQNRRAGRARNVGANNAMGRYLWFLDADDYYFENHFAATAPQLDARPDIGFVRTAMYIENIDDQVSSSWRTASEFTYPCNICVRRECHDLVGGFPEEEPFGGAGPEDVAYSRALGQMFICGKTETVTVHYSMRPGNVLDRLKEDMLSGRQPGEGCVATPGFVAVEILIRRRLHALQAKRGMVWNGPPIMQDGRAWVVRY